MTHSLAGEGWNNANLTEINGWWWPADDRDAHPIITHDCEPALTKLLAHVPRRKCIVQAGANVGVYPCALARRFEAVFTCEPDPRNFECLKANLIRHDRKHRVTALHAAFGSAQGACKSIEVSAGNCGAHRVTFDAGDVPVWPIDDLELTACDAIWLDVEGSELFALQGAEQTIARFSPVIACEEKGLGAQFFGLPGGALEAWLTERGYAEVDRIGNDLVFKRTA
jgi:FkbM family methyltransferase